MSWFNSDGLLVKIGTEEATVGKGGAFGGVVDKNTLEFDLDLTVLATATDSIVDDNIWLPKNARIEEVEIEVITGAVGATATLDIGLIGTDRTTVDSATGLAAAVPVASLDTAGKRLNLITGSTGAGAKLGLTLAGVRLITAGANTAVFTAGLLKVRTKFIFL